MRNNGPRRETGGFIILCVIFSVRCVFPHYTINPVLTLTLIPDTIFILIIIPAPALLHELHPCFRTYKPHTNHKLEYYTIITQLLALCFVQYTQRSVRLWTALYATIFSWLYLYPAALFVKTYQMFENKYTVLCVRHGHVPDALGVTNYVMFHVKHICDKYVAPFVHGHMTVYVVCTLSMC